MASGKRCHYEVLDLPRDCTADEIRSAYRRLALQRHPDKLVQSGLSQAEATAQFQELQHAYEVLSDPKERAWYDSHRSQILFSDPNSRGNSVPDSFIPNLFSFFSNTVYSGYSDSGKGFYKVYSDLFDKVQANEVNFARKLGLRLDSVRQAPVMGNLESPYTQVTAFYNYWLGFCTVMDFCWVDQYDVMAGPNRKSRRVMEEENKKLRKKARKDYNETVRGLAEFVKKRDKRVIDMMVKKNMEMEKRKEEERERKKTLEKEKMERAMAYEEPDWAKVEEEEEEEGKWFEEVEEEKRKNADKELYCVVCGKKFKSEKQWKNHEQSKKHKEKVAEFRESLGDEEEVDDNLEVEVEGGRTERLRSDEEGIENGEPSGLTNDGVDDLEEQIRDGLRIPEDDYGNGIELSDDNDGFFDAEDDKEGEGISETVGLDDDDEMGVLEAMMAGHKSRKKVNSRHEPKVPFTSPQAENGDDGVGFMEYDNQKSTRRKRGAKNENGKKNSEETKLDTINANIQEVGANGNENSYVEEFSSESFVETGSNGKGNEQLARDKKTSKQPAGRKDTEKKDTNIKAKNSSKGRKAKATSKNSSNLCETCGEEFESRNKLHKHLGDTGHAALKYR
ncbi:DNAJ protein [Quillaja saponaria]|uniref:DNAJ protein n=1 Tax=Quillaja saponaria TaxID=32244 RepID=A0AAD7LE50_QUISA|nr:DNAJ protein [Quillaja saponaria]